MGLELHSWSGSGCGAFNLYQFQVKETFLFVPLLKGRSRTRSLAPRFFIVLCVLCLRQIAGNRFSMSLNKSNLMYEDLKCIFEAAEIYIL